MTDELGQKEKQLCPNRCIILVLIWKGFGNPRKTSVRMADVHGDIWEQQQLKTFVTRHTAK
jgi:hypothetical protein